jgi:hypothetical protein
VGSLSLVESYPAETYHIVRARVTLFPPLRPPLAIRDEESPFGRMDASQHLSDTSPLFVCLFTRTCSRFRPRNVGKYAGTKHPEPTSVLSLHTALTFHSSRDQRPRVWCVSRPRCLRCAVVQPSSGPPPIAWQTLSYHPLHPYSHPLRPWVACVRYTAA